MSIYHANTLSDDKTTAYLGFANELKSTDTSHRLSGEKITRWIPLNTKWGIDNQFLNETGKSKSDVNINDFVLLVGAGVNIVSNIKTKRILEKTLTNDMQFLPVNIIGEEHEWYLLNPLNKIDDAISEEKSQYRELSSGRRMLKKPVFANIRISDNTTFVIPPAYHKWYVKGDFLKNIVNQHGLTGLNFDRCNIDITEEN